MIPQQEGFCNPQPIIVMRDFHGSDSVQHTVAFPVTYDYCSFVFCIIFNGRTIKILICGKCIFHSLTKSTLLHPAQGNLQKNNFLFETNAGGSMGGLGLSLIPFQLSLLDKVHICNNFLLTRMSTPLFMASRSSNSILMDLQKI